eukprot:811266-Pleurochrysis_carterae.AAC.4
MFLRKGRIARYWTLSKRQYKSRTAMVALHGVERLGDLRVVAHVDKDGRRLDIRVVAVLVGHEMVRVMPCAPPLDSVPLPERAQKVANRVVPVHELLGCPLEDRVVKIVMRRLRCAVTQYEIVTEQHNSRVVKENNAADARLEVIHN